MARILLALILATAAVSCQRASRVQAPESASERDGDRACAAAPGPAARHGLTLSTAEPPDGEHIASLAIEGARTVPAALIERAIHTRVGAPYESGVADQDLVRILELGAFSDARFLTERREEGLRVIVQVTERATIRRVLFAAGSSEPRAGEWTPVLEGDAYDGRVVYHKVRALQQTMRAEGYLDAVAYESAARVGDDEVDVCVHVARGPEWRIESLEFPGAMIVSATALAAEIDTHRDTVNVAGHHYRADLLEHDVRKMNVLHWEKGLMRARISPPSVTRVEATHRLRVVLAVEEGPVFRVRRVRVSGAASGARGAYEAMVAPLRGTTFARSRMSDVLSRLREHHCKSGRNPDCNVEPSTELHDAEATVDIVFRLEGS